MNKITEVTRRNIFDVIQLEKTRWSGRLDEPDFLSRIFDLSKLPSNDHRFSDAYSDIWQHRTMNDDWGDYWIFTDNRFNFLYCDDYVFLQFLCEMIHPIVRPELTEVNKLLQFFNDCLLPDGFTIVEKMKISDKPVFIGKQTLITNKSISKKNEEIAKILTTEHVFQQINRMEHAVNNDDIELALGTSKELIDTICITILQEKGIQPEKDWDTPKLFKETTNGLKLTPKNIPEDVKGSSVSLSRS